MRAKCAVILIITGVLSLFLTTHTVATADPFDAAPVAPEEQGMDSALLQEMMELITAQNARTDSRDTIDAVIVLRGGRVVLEEYPNWAYTQRSTHHLFSVTKSITSLLIGIAIDRGLIAGVGDSILSYFPSLLPESDTQPKSRVTIEHLLTMSAGLAWDEDTYPTADPRNDFTKLEISFDPIALVLGKPLVADPGELFWYNSGLSHVLSALIFEVSGQSLLSFARDALFEPLGIRFIRWNQDRAGTTFGGTQLYMTPRDLARIGFVCVNDGMWGEERLLSSQWIDQSTRTHIHGRPDYFAGSGYGYHWWTRDAVNAYYASGTQGQNMTILPEEDLVIVFTATIQDGDIFPTELIRDYILPAIHPSP